MVGHASIESAIPSLSVSSPAPTAAAMAFQNTFALFVFDVPIAENQIAPFFAPFEERKAQAV